MKIPEEWKCFRCKRFFGSYWDRVLHPCGTEGRS